jgi:hypothetical protein
VSDTGFVAALAASIAALFFVVFGLLDLDGTAADAYALLTLGSAWLLLNAREANH